MLCSTELPYRNKKSFPNGSSLSDPDWIQTSDLPDSDVGMLYSTELPYRNKKSFPNGSSLSDPYWIQTSDLLLRRQLLYSTELPDQITFSNPVTFPTQTSGCS